MKLTKTLLITVAGTVLTMTSASAAALLTASGSPTLTGGQVSGLTWASPNSYWDAATTGTLTGATALKASTTQGSAQGYLYPDVNVGGRDPIDNVWSLTYDFSLGAGAQIGDTFTVTDFTFDVARMNSTGAPQAQNGSARFTAELYSSTGTLLTSGTVDKTISGAANSISVSFANPTTEYASQNVSLKLIVGNTLNSGFYTATKGFTLNGDVTPVPEPSTYALIAGVAALGLVALRRRKRA